MIEMLQVEIDSGVVEELVSAEIARKIQEVMVEQTFWDMKTLCQKTCMSRTFVLETFFFEPDFPRYKVGNKWLMPARETQEFLVKWLKRQPKI